MFSIPLPKNAKKVAGVKGGRLGVGGVGRWGNQHGVQHGSPRPHHTLNL